MSDEYIEIYALPQYKLRLLFYGLILRKQNKYYGYKTPRNWPLFLKKFKKQRFIPIYLSRKNFKMSIIYRN